MGEWNRARIVSQGNHVTTYLNGRRILEYERGSDAFRAAVAASKFKNIPDFGNGQTAIFCYKNTAVKFPSRTSNSVFWEN